MNIQVEHMNSLSAYGRIIKILVIETLVTKREKGSRFAMKNSNLGWF